jgi:SAM-dependent methyltransferase
MKLALSLVAAAMALAAASVPALGQNAADRKGQEYTPQVGQSGKDVVWVPTPDALVEQMLRMARVTKNDYVIDLGSGDGRTVIAAAQKFGARASGIEYNPDMVELSKRNAEKAGLGDKVQFMKADIFESDFSKATVITMYLLPGINLRLRPKILDLRPGTRIVSHAFNMEEWEPDQTATVEGRDAYLWIVPAKVQGAWTLTMPSGSGEESWQVALKQSFQKLTGTARLGDQSFELSDARMRGPDIRFTFTDANGTRREFNGRAQGDRLEGTTKAQGGATVKWAAVRGGKPG